MSAKSMDVFALRDTVVGEYRKFATSFTTIHAEDIRQQVEAIYPEVRFWPEQFIQINPSYKKGANFENLIGGGALESRTRAIIIYPMNALANSQLEELDKFIKNTPIERHVTFSRYTGQEDTEEWRRNSENPPDILLTNFMMLELQMTRQAELDRRVIGNCAGLRALSMESGRDVSDCRLALRSLFLVSSIPDRVRAGTPDESARSFFAFKLHQFISGVGYAYATLEAPGQRTVTADGQQFLSGEPYESLYPVHFCLSCEATQGGAARDRNRLASLSAESTLRQVLSYWLWFDQRRDWHYTNPNLEQLDLVEVDYLGLAVPLSLSAIQVGHRASLPWHRERVFKQGGQDA